MSVKIDRTTGNTSVINETRNRTSGTQPADGAASQVHLSGLAAQLQSSAETPSFDVARVSEIKEAIADGRFTINASAVADRLIVSATELISTQRRA